MLGLNPTPRARKPKESGLVIRKEEKSVRSREITILAELGNL